MATPPAPAPSIPPNVAAARQQVVSTDFFALCYLMLCQLAYTDENSGSKAVQQIKKLLPAMPVPSGHVKGQWSIGWGPVVSPDNSNLMYAAEFSDSGSKLPVFAAVVIRGTDTQAQPSGILKQVIEDLDATHQVAFPTNNHSGAKIARGTQLGFNTLMGFKDGGRNVETYLKNFVAAHPGAPVVVTGHSLGGCQTTVVALHLASTVPGTKIVPNSFAAPTAGNADFIKLYEKTFSFCPRWFNNIDLVPMAFAGLGGIKGLWSQCKRPAPDALKIVIDAFEVLLKFLKVSYSQESSGNSRLLHGICQPPKMQPVSASVQQKAVAEVQALFHDAVKKLQHDVSKIPLVGGVAAHGLSFEMSANSFQNLGAWVEELMFQHLILTGYWDLVKASKGVAPIPDPFEKAAGAKA